MFDLEMIAAVATVSPVSVSCAVDILVLTGVAKDMLVDMRIGALIDVKIDVLTDVEISVIIDLEFVVLVLCT